MGKVTGFLEVDRQDRKYSPAADRIRNYKEFVLPLSEELLRAQASSCLLYTSPSPRDRQKSRMPSSA